MKIAFYNNHHYWGGLANNGGSRTILLSCAVLREMKHKANVVTNCDRFTWFKHEKPWETVPGNTDAIIAVSISDVPVVQHSKASVRAYWARPMETWQKSEKECLKTCRKFVASGGLVMVNSGWQVHFLHSYGIPAVFVPAGMDFDKWGTRRRRGKMRLLCRYSTNPVKRWKDYERLRKMLGDAYEFCAVGTEKYKKPGITYYKNITQPSMKILYQDADYFFVPNRQEGWYNCAAEAALCGCTLVVNNSPHNGCMDFVTAENAIVYESLGEAVERIKRGDSGMKKDVRKRIKQIGNRQECMERMVDTLYKNL
jgi:hypothetical protein